VTVPEQKRDLRAEFRRRLANMSAEDRASASEEIRRRLEGIDPWRSARCVMAFAARPDEPELAPALQAGIKEGKTIALPRFNPATGLYEAALVADWKRDLVAGAFGIPEPRPDGPVVALNQLDLVLVPGLAFDAKGARLGRGKGFYDRLLVDVIGHRCGVLFEWQLVEEVPLEPHDRLMNSILTPAHWRPVLR
jgi:5-formyltetrahydrofolate cyclo-ligase